MIEAWAADLDQAKFVEAVEYGTEEANKIIELIKASKAKETIKTNIVSGSVIADEPDVDVLSNKSDEINKLQNTFYMKAYSQLYDVFTNYEHDKKSRDNSISLIRKQVINSILTADNKAKYPYIYNFDYLSEYFMKFVKTTARDLVLEESKRIDGRQLDELRQISCEKDLFRSLHGSSLFQRGQTQVLCSITFDSPDAMYKSESISAMMSPSLTNFNKNFMLHYEFPQYAVNEISRIGGRSDRREIGHGALAEKAMYPMIPDDYPFTIRAHCEVLESNGSSSMASVCATSMALLDAGVPIKSPVAGVAMGIITKSDETKQNIVDYKILTDINGFEDYVGDMDFKIAGTTNGVTACQVHNNFN